MSRCACGRDRWGGGWTPHRAGRRRRNHASRTRRATRHRRCHPGCGRRGHAGFLDSAAGGWRRRRHRRSRIGARRAVGRGTRGGKRCSSHERPLGGGPLRRGGGFLAGRIVDRISIHERSVGATSERVDKAPRRSQQGGYETIGLRRCAPTPRYAPSTVQPGRGALMLRGNQSTKVEPRPMSDARSTRPPCDSTIWRTMVSPRPERPS